MCVLSINRACVCVRLTPRASRPRASQTTMNEAQVYRHSLAQVHSLVLALQLCHAHLSACTHVERARVHAHIDHTYARRALARKHTHIPNEDNVKEEFDESPEREDDPVRKPLHTRDMTHPRRIGLQPPIVGSQCDTSACTGTRHTDRQRMRRTQRHLSWPLATMLVATCVLNT